MSSGPYRILRQRTTWILAILVVVVLLSGAGLSALAVWEPQAPGEALYPLQHWVEQVRLLAIRDKTQLAEHLLDLTELRLQDLEYRIGTPFETLALTELDATLNRTLTAIDAAPPDTHPRLLTRLATLAARYKSALGRMTALEASNHDLYSRALAKANTLLQLSSDRTASTTALANIAAQTIADPTPSAGPTAPPTPVSIAAHPVPFPPDATPGPHDFFPLTGAHASLACAACHANGIYKGTTTVCADCHSAVIPANHFEGSCDNCHITVAWKPAKFDHRTAAGKDCSECHLSAQPANHFGAPCATCHTDTNNWKNASFDHFFKRLGLLLLMMSRRAAESSTSLRV